MLADKWITLIYRNFLVPRHGSIQNVIQRGITRSKVNSSYYELLGITPNATQGDIKAAYYKLSMLYHPDKNKGSEIAAQKFRDISTAYEVLGNLRLRKLYDKGITRDSGSLHASPAYREKQENEDDAQTRFYKAHMKKSQVPTASGRTPIYNFDEWSRAHYAGSFERKQQAKKMKDVKTDGKGFVHQSRQREVLLGFVMASVLLMLWTTYEEMKHDFDQIPKKKS